MFEPPPQPDGTTAPVFGQFGNLTLLEPDPQPAPDPTPMEVP